MSDLEKAVQTQLTNIQKKTGKTLEQLHEIVKESGLGRHGEILKMLKTDLGMGHGDANLIANLHLKAAGGPIVQQGLEAPSEDAALDEIYAGAKAPLRPIHEAAMNEIRKLGEFEVVPKKGYVSLRRKKQFAMVGLATKGRIEVGLNLKDLDATTRLVAMPPGGMCQYKVFLSRPEDVDGELLAWVRLAYDAAG